MNTLHLLAILSAQAAILALLAFVVIHALRTWLTARARCWIWGLVVLRLCLPVSLHAPFSLFNLLNPSAVVVSPTPRATSAGRTVEQPERSPRTAPVPLPGRIQSPGEPLMAEAPSSEPARLIPSPTPTDAPALEIATPWTWMIWATWAAGALALMGRTAWLALRMHRTVARGVPATSPTLAAALDHARRLTGVRQPIRVVAIPGMHSPALHGGWHPTLLVPPSVERLLTPAQLRHVLLHECAHVRRRDIALNWLMTVLLALHWFNPAVWLAFARLRAERELACDEIALEAAGKDEGEAYGRTLLHLLTTWSDASPIVTPGALGLLERHLDLRRRLRHIADFRPGRRLGIPAALVIVLAGAVTLTDAQSPNAATTNGPGAMALSSNLPPVVPLRYTNALAKPEDKDLHSGGNWAKAPRGSNVLGGVHFEIDGLVQLASKPSVADQRGFREFVTLPTPTNCYGSVHLLAAAAWSSEPNRRVADFLWRYADGTFKRSPVLYTGHVRDWWRRPFEEPRHVHSKWAKCAVTWSSADALKNQAALRMYRVTLANPEPKKPVAFVQLQSAMDASSLLVLGVSMDPLAAGQRPDPTPDVEPVDPEWTRHLGVTVIDAGTSNVVGGARVKATVVTAGFSTSRDHVANGSGVADVLLPDEPVAEVRVEASATGHSATLHRFQFAATSPPPAFVTVRLHGGLTLGGVVLNAAGQPVEGAVVSVYRFWSGDENRTAAEDTAFHGQRTRTGADGRWEVGSVPANRLNRIGINFAHEDYIHASISGVSQDAAALAALKEKRHEMRLVPGLFISGIVLDPEGRPVAKADVRAGLLHSEDSRAGTTDATGRFRIGGRRAGETVVTAQAKGFGAAMTKVQVDAKDSPVTLRLQKARVFSGVVNDADDRPLADVFVGLESSFPFLEPGVANLEFRTRTGTDGTWTWDSGPETEVKFSFGKEGFAGKSGVAIQPGEPATVVLTKPRVVEGVVLDAESGEPVREFRVEPRGRWWSGEDARSFTSPDGRFVLSLPSDHYDELRVTSPTHEPLVETLPAANQGVIQVTLRLKPGEDGSGTVVDPAGRPVAGATVAYAAQRGGVSLASGRLESWGASWGQARVIESAADGSFRLAPIQNAMAVVAATPEGFGLASLAEFRATRRVRLLPYGGVRVTYRGPGDDDGMARLVLGLFTDVGGPLLHVESPGGSDGAVAVGGNVPFTQVPPGHHQVMRRIRVGTNAWSQRAVRDVAVEPGKVTTLDIDP